MRGRINIARLLIGVIVLAPAFACADARSEAIDANAKERAAYEKRIEKARADLLDRYTQLIDKLEKNLKDKGDIPGVIAARKEKNRLKEDATVPEADQPKLHSRIRTARTQYHSSRTRIDQQSKQGLEALHKKQLARLEALGKSLIGSDKLQDASAIMALIKEMKAAGPDTGTETGAKRGGLPEPRGKPGNADNVESALVIIRAGSGSGSGFIAKMDGHEYIFTNQHVIQGAANPEFRLISGETLKPLSRDFAGTEDVARVAFDTTAVKSSYAALEFATGTSKVGEPIRVYGNSQGAGAATLLTGSIRSVQPSVIDVSATFVSGNSGSPILDRNYKVIAVAAWVQLDPGKRFSAANVHRFGYRVTPDTQWLTNVEMSWLKQGRLLQDLRKYCENLYGLRRAIRISGGRASLPGGGRFDLEEASKAFHDPRWPRAIGNIVKRYGLSTTGNGNRGDNEFARKMLDDDFRKRLKPAQQMLGAQSWVTGFFKKEVERLGKLEAEIIPK